MVFTDYEGTGGWGSSLQTERWFWGSLLSATLPHQFIGQTAPALNIFMPRPWKSRECSRPQNFSFLTCHGKVTRWLHKWLWGRQHMAGQAENRKGLEWNGTEALAETSFLLRQFTEVLQLRSSEWASLQKFWKASPYSPLVLPPVLGVCKPVVLSLSFRRTRLMFSALSS